MADPLDLPVLERAREEAARVLSSDAALDDPDLAAVRDQVRARFGGRLDALSVS